MYTVKKLLCVTKQQALDLDLDVVKLGSAIVVGGHPDKIKELGGIEQPVTEYDEFKLWVLGDE